jgi:ZIP family zinc transporter
MSFGETVLLGGLAGSTIFLGLPFARLKILGTRGRVALSMFAVGVLAFLFVDVLEHAFAILEGSVVAYKDGKQGIGESIGFTALLAVGFGAGTAGLATAERRLRPKGPTRPPVAGASSDALPAAVTAKIESEADAARSRALQTSMVIAVAIGLHNFAEGLAIGVSASTGEIGLATVLIIGFALHNATEGFGIVGPLGPVRPSWRWLGVAGLVAGGPTFLGSMVGYNFTAEPLQLAFYAVSGGAILFVVGEVWNGMRRFGHRELGLSMVTAGFMIGIVTDLVVVYGGG